MDFLKGISAQLLPGVQELQRRDLLHRASVVFPIDDKESDEEVEDLLTAEDETLENDGNIKNSPNELWGIPTCVCFFLHLSYDYCTQENWT